MKKLSLATIIIVTLSISLVGCTNSGVVSNNDSNTNNSVNSGVDGKNSNRITIEQAKEIALKHAGLTKDQVSFIETENDIDNGRQKYDIEFYCNGKEYDYEISAINGEIIQFDNDINKYNNQNNNQSNTQNNNVNNVQSNAHNTADISLDKAKQIALSHAGLTSSQVTFKRTELDFDDGIQKYEVEFYYNNREYSYEINANTGDILSYEQD